MSKTKGISPKLAGAIGPPLTAVVTAAILSGTVDRASLAALAAIAIGAALGWHAPRGQAADAPTITHHFTMPDPAPPAAEDLGDDGDDALPAELADHPAATSVPVDEIDSPDQTQEG